MHDDEVMKDMSKMMAMMTMMAVMMMKKSNGVLDGEYDFDVEN